MEIGINLGVPDSRKRFIAQFFKRVHFDSDDQIVVAADGVHLLDAVDAAQGLVTTLCMVANNINEDKCTYGHDAPPMGFMGVHDNRRMMLGSARCLTKRIDMRVFKDSHRAGCVER